MSRRRGEDGQLTLMIVGLAVVLAMAVAMTVDASAAYLHRQGLDAVADGAALAGADAGASGEDLYTDGVPDERLEQFAATAQAGVADYLARSGARERFPGLTYDVRIDPTARTVIVQLRAPLKLPLTVPGTRNHTVVSARGSAVVTPQR